MTFREPGGADGKTAQFPDVADELVRKLEAALGFLEHAVAAGRIAAQRQDVFDADAARLGDDLADLRAGVVDAGQVEHGGEVVLALDAVHDHEGLVARAAPGAVGDGTEVGLEPQQRGNGFFEQIAVAFLRFRREEFKGNDRALGGQSFGDDVADKLH